MLPNVMKFQELLKNNIAKQLLFIKSNYSFVSDSILALEKKSRPPVESIQVVEDFYKNSHSVQGETGKNVAGKLNDVIDKNLGYKYLKDISNFLLGGDDLHLEYSVKTPSRANRGNRIAEVRARECQVCKNHLRRLQKCW